MVAGKSFFFSKIGVQSCVRFRCTLLHSYFALHTLNAFERIVLFNISISSSKSIFFSVYILANHIY
jgi:hypothetical protein